MSKGMLLVVSAPSGCGKTTILTRVMRLLPGLVFSISHTTRSPRPGERDGIDYHFTNESAFVAMRDRQPTGFLEWAEVHGNMYGTSVAAVHEQQQAGLDVILDIDVQGAAQVRDRTTPVTVFIAPPSLAELERRLRKRGSEAEAAVALRLANAQEELDCAETYDYLIVNDKLDVAVESLKSIIIAERLHRRRAPTGETMRWSR